MKNKRQKTQYLTLAELRADKLKAEQRLVKRYNQLHDDVVDSFMPDKSYSQSEVPYMRYIGYGITAYKTAMTVKKFFDFFHRRSWRG